MFHAINLEYANARACYDSQYMPAASQGVLPQKADFGCSSGAVEVPVNFLGCVARVASSTERIAKSLPERVPVNFFCRAVVPVNFLSRAPGCSPRPFLARPSSPCGRPGLVCVRSTCLRQQSSAGVTLKTLLGPIPLAAF